jgi:DNA-binding MarR family transcriptional regulator
MNFGEDLSLQVMLAHKSYHHYLLKVLKEIDIYQHYQIILLLSRSGRATQKSLCENLQIEKSNMVAIMDLLESKNYITREVNYKDRRGRLITLTPKSTKVIELLDSLFASFEEHITDEITWQEMHNCLRVLKKVNDKFRDLINQPAYSEGLKKVWQENNSA